MDFMILQGITAGAVHRHSLSMANGANLAYDKTAFEKVEGFKNIDHIASGDDMLLVYKFMKAFPGGYNYCKSRRAVIATTPMKTWSSFFSQRIRWASKAKYYDDKRLLPVLLIVYLQNLVFLPVLLMALFNPAWWLCFILLWLVKTLVELPLFFSVSSFFRMKWTLPYFILLQPLHVGYTIVSGFLGLFSSYTWKGRKVK
jgi:cellulose synthase/poly-beta-1,6-N-acetylglucosamine synthase-like glycosyltransferase